MTEAHLARPPPEFSQVKGLCTAGYEQSRRRDSNPQPPVYKAVRDKSVLCRDPLTRALTC